MKVTNMSFGVSYNITVTVTRHDRACHGTANSLPSWRTGYRHGMSPPLTARHYFFFSRLPLGGVRTDCPSFCMASSRAYTRPVLVSILTALHSGWRSSMTPSAPLYVPEMIRTGSPSTNWLEIILKSYPVLLARHKSSTQFDIRHYLCFKQKPRNLGKNRYHYKII